MSKHSKLKSYATHRECRRLWNATNLFYGQSGVSRYRMLFRWKHDVSPLRWRQRHQTPNLFVVFSRNEWFRSQLDLKIIRWSFRFQRFFFCFFFLFVCSPPGTFATIPFDDKRPSKLRISKCPAVNGACASDYRKEIAHFVSNEIKCIYLSLVAVGQHQHRIAHAHAFNVMQLKFCNFVAVFCGRTNDFVTVECYQFNEIALTMSDTIGNQTGHVIGSRHANTHSHSGTVNGEQCTSRRNHDIAP